VPVLLVLGAAPSAPPTQMLQTAVGIALAAVLAVSAGFKLAAPGTAHTALATFGLAGDRLRWIAWALLVSTELSLAAGLAVGLDAAAYGAALLLAVFAVAQVLALRAGRGGAPCGCFGARSRVGWPGVARNALLAAAALAIPLLPNDSLTTDEWLGLGLGLALIACAALTVGVLALAREVGMLRLQLGPQSALEIPDEGPEIGSRSGVIDRFDRRNGAEVALAVFASEGCPMCRALEPSIAALARDPALAVRTFQEGVDRLEWEELDVPGSPYAVALHTDGTVLAKGTFNNLAQLDSVLATAARRREEIAEGLRA
jgi:hypothetical protein